jgi:hypothetical protein
VETENSLEREKILTELEVIINDPNNDYTVNLKGYDNIYGFFKKEHERWNSLLDEIKKNNLNSLNLRNLCQYFNNLTSRLFPLKNSKPPLTDIDFNKSWQETKNAIEKPPAPRKYYSTTSLGEFIIAMYQKHAQIGDGCFKYFDNTAIDIHNHFELRGYLYSSLFEKRLTSESIKLELESFQKANNEVQEKTALVSQSFEKNKAEMNLWREQFENDQDGWKQEFQDGVDKYIKEQKEKFSNLDQSYSQKLKVEGPVKYWSDRAESYKKKGIYWLIGFCSVVVIFLAFLTIVLYHPPAIFNFNILKGEPLAIKSLIIFALIVSGLLYLAKVFAKMTFSSFHIERDAEEREQLTMVYLALTKEGKITEKERDIVLQSIFSRVDIGILGEDSSPTMPYLGNILNK